MMKMMEVGEKVYLLRVVIVFFCIGLQYNMDCNERQILNEGNRKMGERAKDGRKCVVDMGRQVSRSKFL
jgi:hypothetical protein